MNICFWNTKKSKDINKYVTDIIKEKDCDIFVLIEYDASCEELCTIINSEHEGFASLMSWANTNIVMIHKQDVQADLNIDMDRYCSICVNRDEKKFEIFIVHLPSNLYSDKEANKELCNRMSIDIEKSNIPVLVLGDFNMNPFDKELISWNGLFALPNDEHIKKSFYQKEKISLYNPMWKFFGDFSKSPGTYYYDKEQIHCYYWYIYDQVLFTKEINDMFDKNSLNIIKGTKNFNFIKNKKIDTEISDHLPVFFSLKED